MKQVCLICFYFCFFTSCKTKQKLFEKVNKDVPFIEVGYLINLYGDKGVWIFQPCKDKNINVLDAINGTSFFVQDIENDLFYTSLKDSKGIGDKMPLTFYDNFFHKEVKDTMEYFYCKLTINPIDMPKKEDSCAYTIKHGQRKKGLACWSLTNYVKELEPLGYNQRTRYIQILHKKKRSLPQWADKG